MSPLSAAYLFLLGLASGLALLAISAYLRVSPRWLRWLLCATGLFVVSRYITMALFTTDDALARYWMLRQCWFASAIGLTLPGVMAIDQLLRHPAMSPKKLLAWFSPFLAVYLAVILFGSFTPVQDPWLGWAPQLGPGWRMLLSVTQGVFVIGFLSAILVIARKLPVRAVRRALLGLALGFAYLGVDGLILACGGSYFRPFLFSEMLALISLWYAYDTALRLQQESQSLSY